jgi:hypothetical protein
MRKGKNNIIQLITLGLVVLCMYSCSTTRTVPEGDRLYTGATIKWEDKNKPKDYSTLKDGLSQRVRPAPNSKLLGMPIKLWLYNLGNKPKGKGLNYLLREKWGQAPVLLSQAKPKYTSNVLEQYLVDNGYFDATTTFEVVNKGKKKASITYKNMPDHRYTIQSITFDTDSTNLGKAVHATEGKSLLVVGNPYSLDKIKAERERIHSVLKEQGYYYFTPDFLIVLVDSSNLGKVNLFLKVKETTPALARRPYIMHDVTLYPDYTLENDSASITGKVVHYQHLDIIDPEHLFKPIVFERSVFLRPDSLYRQSSHNITLQRLVNLGTFKFVKGVFATVRDNSASRNHMLLDSARAMRSAQPEDSVITSRRTRRLLWDSTQVATTRPSSDTSAPMSYVKKDSAQLKDSSALRNRRLAGGSGLPRFNQVLSDTGQLSAKFYLTPYPRRSLQAELRGTSKSNNYVGSEIKITARNRNWLHAANLLELSLGGGMEWQTGGNVTAAGAKSYGLKGEASITIPRFLTPIRGLNIRTPYVPRTRIGLSYELYSRSDLYNLSAYSTQLQYLWRKTPFLDHNLAPIAISYVLPSRTTPAYDSILLNDPSQRNAISKQFILGSNYTVTYSTLTENRIHSFYISGNIDVSGNLMGLIVKKGADSLRKIFDNPFAQYARLSLDSRHYWKLSKGMTWVNRVYMGYGLPYGNSTTLPFIKQYFIGGSSSIRAFRARTLGPGSYMTPDTLSSLLANEAGDIKLEGNSELRIHLFSVVNGAIFVDAGNIWLQKEVPQKPGSQFKLNTFYKEIAVGTGAGIRIDASIVVVRFDVAFPLRKPWLPEKERWVINQIQFGSPEWRKENLILNIAIGYPF